MISEQQVLATIVQFNCRGQQPTSRDIASRGFGLSQLPDPTIHDILVRMVVDGRLLANVEFYDELDVGDPTEVVTYRVPSEAIPVKLAAE
ncbi:hypothetical protein [Microvirga puerhi]|uniref:Uncharacterized protein n=1 Tax=Microvirga puerhi TaxID=2876078 RepID=A0ABS7VVH5_9HYPH|nr:hypothetical protein [Microvirga puerhi]MBZ6078912.1 hypothetical protein [Microvirga puerhi]